MKVWKCVVNNKYYFVYGETKKDAFRAAASKETHEHDSDFYFDEVNIEITEADAKEVFEWVQAGNTVSW